MEVPIEGYIWCDHHGEVHEEKRDPYEDGSKECKENVWRKIMAGESVPMPKPKPMTPFSKAWEKAANKLARCEVTIFPCADCHGPVVYGYCCTRCGSDDPGRDGHDEWTHL